MPVEEGTLRGEVTEDADDRLRVTESETNPVRDHVPVVLNAMVMTTLYIQVDCCCATRCPPHLSRACYLSPPAVELAPRAVWRLSLPWYARQWTLSVLGVAHGLMSDPSRARVQATRATGRWEKQPGVGRAEGSPQTVGSPQSSPQSSSPVPSNIIAHELGVPSWGAETTKQHSAVGRDACNESHTVPTARSEVGGALTDLTPGQCLCA
jgi:hypothetical protein